MSDKCLMLDQAKEHWQKGRVFEAGKLIFEQLPDNARPKWAVRILRFALEESGVQNEIFELLLYTADHQSMWWNGHRVFSEIRKVTLKIDELRRRQSLTKEQEMLSLLLPLAELVAKVTYNATSPPDEFDKDSGWNIVSRFNKYLEQSNQEYAGDLIWNLVSKEFVID